MPRPSQFNLDELYRAHAWRAQLLEAWGAGRSIFQFPRRAPKAQEVLALFYQHYRRNPEMLFRLMNSPEVHDPEDDPKRMVRFTQLREEGKSLGEINRLLEAEGFPEVTHGPGLVACPTKQHEIVRENKGARRMIESL